MPAKWQQWMPFNIDAFKSSPAVRAMHPSARSGYLYLLAYAWQTDDCTLPQDQMDLAEISEIGDELWDQHGARIMRKFQLLESGRYQNATLFEEWDKARRIFAKNHASPEEVSRKRSEAGQKGNKVRWKNRKPSQTDNNCDRIDSQTDSKSSLTGTGTGTGTETEVQDIPLTREPEPETAANPPSPAFVEAARKVGESLYALTELARDYFEGRELQVANDLFREFKIPANHSLTTIAGQSLVFECERLGSPGAAIESMRKAMGEAKARGDTINRFWFEDQEYDETKRARKENAESKPGTTQQRLNATRSGIYEAAVKRGLDPTFLGISADGRKIPGAGNGGQFRGPHLGSGTPSPEALHPGSDRSAGGAPDSPRPTILPPAG